MGYGMGYGMGWDTPNVRPPRRRRMSELVWSSRDARRETRNSGRARRLSSSRIVVVVDARDDARDDEDEDEDEDEDDRVIAFGGVDLKSRRAVRASSSEIGLVIDW